MPESTLRFEDFLFDVPPEQMPFVVDLHAEMMERGCTVKVQQAKSGFVVSYNQGVKKRVLFNYIFRKQGLMARVYGDHVAEYPALLENMPEALKKLVVKAPVCRRLHDPSACNARCQMGNVFVLDGEEHRKCRYSNFILPLKEEDRPHVRALIEAELAARAEA